MEIQIRQKCPKCDGSRIVASSFYLVFEQWRTAYLAETGCYPTIEEEDQWLHAQHRTVWPQEELDCDVCSGEGHLYKWIPVKDVLQFLHDKISLRVVLTSNSNHHE